ncbi:unnamed protein product, partial [Symbiodinium sp. KB8]
MLTWLRPYLKRLIDIACESLKAKRARDIEQLYSWPYEDFTVEELLEKLPGPTVEEVDEPMDAVDSSKDAPADSPLGERAESSNQNASNVPMETDAPEGSPQGVGSGVKVEQAEGSLQGEVSGIWGKQKNVVDPKAYKASVTASSSAEANNEKAFENL